MSEVCGAVGSVADVHAVAHRLESGAARLYDDLGAAATACGATETAKVWRGLAAAARRRARIFATAQPPVTPPFSPVPEEMIAAPLAAPPPTPWQAMDTALALEYGALTTLQLLATLAETEEGRAEAARLADRKRQHLAELGQRQAKLAGNGAPA